MVDVRSIGTGTEKVNTVQVGDVYTSKGNGQNSINECIEKTFSNERNLKIQMCIHVYDHKFNKGTV